VDGVMPGVRPTLVWRWKRGGVAYGVDDDDDAAAAAAAAATAAAAVAEGKSAPAPRTPKLRPRVLKLPIEERLLSEGGNAVTERVNAAAGGYNDPPTLLAPLRPPLPLPLPLPPPEPALAPTLGVTDFVVEAGAGSVVACRAAFALRERAWASHLLMLSWNWATGCCMLPMPMVMPISLPPPPTPPTPPG